MFVLSSTQMIKTLLLSHPSCENTTNDFVCYVYKGTNTDEEYQGTLKEAVNNLLEAIQKFCSCDKEQAAEIACGGYQHSSEEWDTFCEEHGQPPSEYQDWVCSFGDWHLFCMPAGTIGAVRGMFYWNRMEIPNDGKLSLHLC